MLDASHKDWRMDCFHFRFLMCFFHMYTRIGSVYLFPHGGFYSLIFPSLIHKVWFTQKIQLPREYHDFLFGWVWNIGLLDPSPDFILLLCFWKERESVFFFWEVWRDWGYCNDLETSFIEKNHSTRSPAMHLSFLCLRLPQSLST